MSFYWANFQNIHGHVFRFDTRIYFHDIGEPRIDDKCIGAVVCKNPGSATGAVCGKLVPVTPDNTLKNINGGIEDAYMQKYSALPAPNEYVQVLNLFYLCDQNLGAAIKKHKKHKNMPFMPTDQAENRKFPWMWYAWGATNTYLNQFKPRFSGKSQQQIYLNNSGNHYNQFPAPPVLARHPLMFRRAWISRALQTVV